MRPRGGYSSVRSRVRGRQRMTSSYEQAKVRRFTIASQRVVPFGRGRSSFLF